MFRNDLPFLPPRLGTPNDATAPVLAIHPAARAAPFPSRLSRNLASENWPSTRQLRTPTVTRFHALGLPPDPVCGDCLWFSQTGNKGSTARFCSLLLHSHLSWVASGRLVNQRNQARHGAAKGFDRFFQSFAGRRSLCSRRIPTILPELGAARALCQERKLGGSLARRAVVVLLRCESHGSALRLFRL